MVFGNMTLNVKMFSNPRADECGEEDEETSCVEVVSQDEVESLCSRDSVEDVISNSCYYVESYTSRDEEIRKTCFLLKEEKGKSIEAMCTAQFMSLPPKTRLVFP